MERLLVAWWWLIDHSNSVAAAKSACLPVTSVGAGFNILRIRNRE